MISTIDILEDFRMEDSEDQVNFTALGNNSPIQEGIFKCFECVFSCSTTIELANHYQIHREKDPFKCFKCGYIGKNRDDFLEHSITHIESNYFKCSKCTFKTNTMKAIRSHVYSKHDKLNLLCSICCQKFTTEVKKNQHEKLCAKKIKLSDEDYSDEEEEYERPIFHNKRRYTRRPKKEKIHNEDQDIESDDTSVKMFTCPTCYYIFPSKEGLLSHDYTNHIKNWKFKKASKASTHLSNGKNYSMESKYPNPYVKLDRFYLCSYCYIIFSSEFHYNDHKATHKIITDCHVCGGSFDSYLELKEHIDKEHSELCHLSCSTCGDIFTSEEELFSHIKSTHSSKGILTCPLCPRLIKTEAGLKSHLEAHSKVKSLKCSNCSYIGINPSDIKKHSRKHGEPTFICPNECGSAYKRPDDLNKHLAKCPKFKVEKIFEDEDMSEIEIDISQKEKLICSECKECFKESSELKKHLLGHFNSSPFRCLKCGIRCGSQQSYDSHVKTHLV